MIKLEKFNVTNVRAFYLNRLNFYTSKVAEARANNDLAQLVEWVEASNKIVVALEEFNKCVQFFEHTEVDE